jgi:hypothetical protein
MEALFSVIFIWLVGHYYEKMMIKRKEDQPRKQMNVESIRDPSAFGRTSHGMDPDHGIEDARRFGIHFGDPDYYIWKQPDPRREHPEFDNSNWTQLFPHYTSFVPANYSVWPNES